MNDASAILNRSEMITLLKNHSELAKYISDVCQTVLILRKTVFNFGLIYFGKTSKSDSLFKRSSIVSSIIKAAYYLLNSLVLSQTLDRRSSISQTQRGEYVPKLELIDKINHK